MDELENRPTQTGPDRPSSEGVPTTDDGIPVVANGRPLTATAIEALREAAARRERQIAAENQPEVVKEVGGADRMTEPTRYGDWEKSGRAIDFS